jgi:two-component system chemotaxis response regulator CheY
MKGYMQMRKKRVLVVDDSRFMRTIIKNTISNKGYDVIGEANNGEQAVKMFIDLKPDLVTMDIVMDKETGLQALKEIMNYDKDANVVMCTSMGQQALVINALALGAKDFVVKPFKEDRIIDALNKIRV